MAYDRFYCHPIGWLFLTNGGEGMVAEVIIDIQNKQVNRTFDYLIPSALEGIIKVGFRVKVPFGNTKRVGFVVNIKEETMFDGRLRYILDTVDVKRVLNEEFVELAKYISENNFSFYATALQTMIPTALKIKYKKIAILVNKDEVASSLTRLFRNNELSIEGLNDETRDLIYAEVKKGNIRLDTKLKRVRGEKTITMVHYNPLHTNKPTSKQGLSLMEFLEELNEDIELSLLLNDSGYSRSVVDTLAKLKIVEIYEKEIIKDEEIVVTDKPITLNPRQKAVYDSVELNKNQVYLLHGVTGSGKTEVYMRWIKEVIDSGKSAIMLVPEISLTPQITALFYARFKKNIAILHSRLDISEKYDAWKKILNGDVKIVVGARSAIFAPLDNLGIIIIDEEHESTYIQQNNPKYNAIELAKIRAKTHNCPLVLGSATPNINDYYEATNGNYKLLELPNRANGRPLPKSEVVDMREELKHGNKSVLSESLARNIKDCYKRGEQSILFLNRRGFSSFVMCRSCGEVIKCPHCDVSLTYHQYRDELRCHYCGYRTSNVSLCPKCGSDKIRFVGTGTEKLMDAVSKLIPEARIIRMDMDTASKIEDYENTYRNFKNHEADILVGTQMITKGLDFENVTLVGVVNADLALQYPIYDASMVAFNLIEQVSGRAGRALKDGKVIIQTYNPEHYVIRAASQHDYLGFYKNEISKRKMASLPPFTSLIEIMVMSKVPKEAFKEAKLISERLKALKDGSIILGPVEDRIFKKNDIFRYVIQIQAAGEALLEQIKLIYPMYQNDKNISLSITRE